MALRMGLCAGPLGGLWELVSLGAWHHTGLWQILDLCWGFGTLYGALGAHGPRYRATQGTVSIFESYVHWDLSWGTIYSGVPAEVLIHTGLWNCDRALYECETGAVIEQAVKKKGCHS